MNSDELNLKRLEMWWLEDPEFQRRAHAITRYLVKRYQLPSVTADDLYQAAMMRLIRYFERHDIGEISNPHAFFYSVARNEIRRFFYQEQHHSQVLVDEQRPPEVSLEDIPQKDFSDNLESVRHIESRLLFEEITESLNEEERRLLYFWINGFTYREIATLIDTSHVTVSNRLSNLIGRIKKSIFKMPSTPQVPEK
jgi:RNA polymerase sigma factor (sigma-70 family)